MYCLGAPDCAIEITVSSPMSWCPPSFKPFTT